MKFDLEIKIYPGVESSLGVQLIRHFIKNYENDDLRDGKPRMGMHQNVSYLIEEKIYYVYRTPTMYVVRGGHEVAS